MTADILRDPLKEIPESWRVQADSMVVPNEPPAHLVEELVSIVESFMEGNPSVEDVQLQLKAMKRLAKAIREESR